jgi:hypothetical protein
MLCSWTPSSARTSSRSGTTRPPVPTMGVARQAVTVRARGAVELHQDGHVAGHAFVVQAAHRLTREGQAQRAGDLGLATPCIAAFSSSTTKRRSAWAVSMNTSTSTMPSSAFIALRICPATAICRS